MSDKKLLLSLRDVKVDYSIRTGFFRWKTFSPFSGISLDIYSGETVGIIGRNGAGKSTLLRLMAGILDPDAGVVINNGARIALLALGVGFVPHLSGRDNAMLSGILLGLRSKQIHEKLEDIISFAELDEFIDSPMRTYSTGMRSRLGFSVAMQIEPDILLIDEVLAVGDEKFKLKTLSAMKSITERGHAVVVVSHSIQALKDMCHRIIWIEDGVIVMEGPTKEVLGEYVAAAKR